MGDKKQVVEKIENKESVAKSATKSKSDENLNYKVNSYKIDTGSKKIKNILIICCIIFIIIACLSSIKGCSTGKKNNNEEVVAELDANVKVTDGVSAGVNKVYDSVVYISSYNGNRSTRGTGFVYKKQGGTAYVLTNYHITANSDVLRVVTSDSRSVTGKYLGGDKYLDIAVISIPSKSNVKVASLASSKNTSLGSVLFTIGSPVGDEYRGTVTKGVLSGKNRSVSVSVNGVRDDYIMKVLQTDAAMSPGSSGGPLCNSSGQVIGVNSMKFANTDIEGMAFAVPIETVNKYLNTFERGNKIKRPYLGISMLNMNEKSSLKNNGLSNLANSSSKNGVAVVAVKGNTAAYGKLKRGDVITKLNGTSVSDIAHLRYELFKYNPNDIVSITVLRDGTSKSIKVKLG